MEQNPHSPAQDARIAASTEAPATQADSASVPETAPATGTALDANGFDPAEYRWLPVRRKPRKDGWTPQRQQDFIAALAETGCVEHAAQIVGMSVRSCNRLRSAPGSEGFSAAWDVALQHASLRLLDVAFDRAFRGTTEPVFDRDGRRVGERFRQNDRLLMFLLRAYMPERFRHAHRDWRGADEPLPQSALGAAPIEQVLQALEPVAPEDPHLLLPPEELEDALAVADILPPGQLPHWLRGKGDAEDAMLYNPAFEAKLERLKLEDDSPRAGQDGEDEWPEDWPEE